MFLWDIFRRLGLKCLEAKVSLLECSFVMLNAMLMHVECYYVIHNVNCCVTTCAAEQNSWLAVVCVGQSQVCVDVLLLSCQLLGAEFGSFVASMCMFYFV